MKPVEECDHATIHFGSGDYYLFCHDCGARWVRTQRDADIAAPEECRGVGTGNSGQPRTKEK